MPDGGRAAALDRNPFVGADDLTMADVLERLEGDEMLFGSRRRDLTSAARRVCDLIGREPALLPALMTEISKGLASVNPAAAGITVKTLQNIKTHVAAALRHVGCTRSPHTARVRLTPEWQALFDRLPGRRYQSGLSRFFRYCSAIDLSPGVVDDDAIPGFVEALRSGTLMTEKQVRDAHRRVTRLWNEAADIGKGWPSAQLTVPKYRAPPATLPLSAFPTPFGEDVERHLAWLAGADPLAEHPPPNPCKPKTVRLRRQHILLAATAYLHRGHPVEDLQSLADLADPDRLKEVLRHYIEKNGGKVTQFTRDLCKAMTLVARYYVRVDAAMLANLKTIKRQLGGDRSGLTEKNRAMLRQFDDDRNRALLYSLPSDVLREVAHKDDGATRWAVKVQVALAVEFLLNLPIRMENLIALEIGTHLIWPSGGKDSLILTLEPGETKTDEPIEFLVPPDLTRFIGRYVEKFRPRLESADSAYLFPGQGGGHKHPSTLSHQMVTLIKKRTGLRVTPHQFRHLAAKISLDAEPGNYFGVATLLGHKSLKTTMAFYSGLRTRAAGKHFASILDRDRQAVSENAGNRRRRSKR